MNPGTKVIIKKKNDEEIKGTIMPSEEEKNIVIKLENGYNIGIKKENIKEITELKEEKDKKEKINKQERKKDENKEQNLPLISILHTGGTIASRVDYKTGAVTAKYDPEEIITQFPEIKKHANIKSQLIKQIMSENIRFAHYNIIIDAIKKEIKKGVKGIIITHGTDTLHYTSAALTFAIENPPIPIILVGAQRSSDRGSSDAYLNLISATYFITKTDYKGIGVCMHETTNDETTIIIPGSNARKMHTSKRDAFKSINNKPIARINYEQKKIEYLREYPKTQENETKIKKFKENIKIGMIYARPGMYAEEIKNYEKYNGIIMIGTGLGHLPTRKIDEETQENEKIRKTIEELTKKMPVAITSQCINGRINLNVYSEGRINKKIGIIGDGTNMTPETAYIKMAWLLSNYDKEKTKELYEQNLRGEITTRSEP